MKQSKFEQYVIQAKENCKSHSRLRIPITTVGNRQIGTLACVDRGMVDDNHIISEMTKWRNKFTASFLTSFLATETRTRTWLEKIVLPAPDRILFIILLCDNDPVGQIGLCNITVPSAELDNVIRGEHRGEKHLTYWAAITLINWAFENATFREITLGVLSSNLSAVNYTRDWDFRKLAGIR
jgi:hypothetical protein